MDELKFMRGTKFDPVFSSTWNLLKKGHLPRAYQDYTSAGAPEFFLSFRSWQTAAQGLNPASHLFRTQPLSLGVFFILTQGHTP